MLARTRAFVHRTVRSNSFCAFACERAGNIGRRLIGRRLLMRSPDKKFAQAISYVRVEENPLREQVERHPHELIRREIAIADTLIHTEFREDPSQDRDVVLVRNAFDRVHVGLLTLGGKCSLAQEPLQACADVVFFSDAAGKQNHCCLG